MRDATGRLGSLGSFLTLAALAAASAASGEDAEPWRADVACGRELSAPAPAPRAGCASSYCIPLADGQVCSCVAADAAEDSIGFSWERDAGEPLRWKVALRGLPDAAAFRVQETSLGAPARTALLVAARAGLSNGMGVEVWSVRAVAGGALSSEVLVEDYGALGFATHPAGEAECHLLATRWLWASSPVRGDGLYLYGRWLHLRDGTLKPDPSRPLVARRYLRRFEKERLAALEGEPRRPLPWFRSAAARPPACGEPFCQ